MLSFLCKEIKSKSFSLSRTQTLLRTTPWEIFMLLRYPIRRCPVSIFGSEFYLNKSMYFLFTRAFRYSKIISYNLSTYQPRLKIFSHNKRSRALSYYKPSSVNLTKIYVNKRLDTFNIL